MLYDIVQDMVCFNKQLIYANKKCSNLFLMASLIFLNFQSLFAPVPIARLRQDFNIETLVIT